MGLRKLTRLHTLLTHYPAPYSGEFLAMLDSDLMHGLPHAYPGHSADWSLTGGYPSTPVGELRVRVTAPYQTYISPKNYIKPAAFIPHLSEGDFPSHKLKQPNMNPKDKCNLRPGILSQRLYFKLIIKSHQFLNQFLKQKNEKSRLKKGSRYKNFCSNQGRIPFQYLFCMKN